MMTGRYSSKGEFGEEEDSEINLHFQDFGGPSSTQGESNDQVIYFNDFPNSAVDDQEQKLLDDDDQDTRSQPSHSFWTFEYYQRFFDVDTKQVGDRILWSVIPKPGVNFLQNYVRPNPDLYGPFWICVTLILTTAVAGNLSNYLQMPLTFKWRYDFHKVTLATSFIFSYAWLVPLILWGVMYWRGSRSNISLLELLCLYGYSLSIFVPVSLLWMIPLRWLQWCVGIVASVLSGSVLVLTIRPAFANDAKKIAVAISIFILILHAALTLGFMLYFFYPPSEPLARSSSNLNLTTLPPKSIDSLNKKDAKTNATSVVSKVSREAGTDPTKLPVRAQILEKSSDPTQDKISDKNKNVEKQDNKESVTKIVPKVADKTDPPKSVDISTSSKIQSDQTAEDTIIRKKPQSLSR